MTKEKDYSEEVGMLNQEIKRLFGGEVSFELKLCASGAELSYHASTEAFSAFNSWLMRGEVCSEAVLKEKNQTIEIIGIDSKDYLSVDVAAEVAFELCTNTLDIFRVQKFGNGYTATSFNHCGSKCVLTTKNTFNPASIFYYECLDDDNNILRVTFDANMGPIAGLIVD